MKQSLFLLSIVFTALFLIAGAYIFRAREDASVASPALPQSMTPKLKVVASFYPLGALAASVGGDAVDVSVLVPAGTEPHEYEPAPQNITALYAADTVLLNGAGLDSWATKLRADLEQHSVRVVVMSEVLGFEDGSGKSRDANWNGDPHFWLNINFVKQEVASIAEVFAGQNESLRALFQTNAETVTQEMQSLDDAYTKTLSHCRQHTIVTTHNAFGYLAQEYGFEALSIAGLSPENEPSAKQLASLATLVRQRNIRFIFFESLVSPRLAQTLADEIGAQTLVFNPLEGLTDEEMAQGKNYLTIMEENLNNLQLAMNCHGK